MTRPSVVSVWTSHATGWHTVALDNDNRLGFAPDATDVVDAELARYGVRVVWDDWTDGMTVRHYALAPLDAEVPA